MSKPTEWPLGAVAWAQDESGDWWAYRDVPVLGNHGWRGNYITSSRKQGECPEDWKESMFIKSPEQQVNMAAETLRAALSHMDDRAATYDNEQGERSMGKCVAMFNSLYGQELTEEQGWAFMCLLKIVRTSQGDFRADNYEDLAAYAGLMRESAGKGNKE